MTPHEAFEVAKRYKQAKQLGMQPRPLKTAPRISGDLYLPGWFLWMCFGRGLAQCTFEQGIKANTDLPRKGTSSWNRVYEVASVRAWLRKCNRRGRVR